MLNSTKLIFFNDSILRLSLLDIKTSGLIYFCSESTKESETTPTTL